MAPTKYSETMQQSSSEMRGAPIYSLPKDSDTPSVTALAGNKWLVAKVVTGGQESHVVVLPAANATAARATVNVTPQARTKKFDGFYRDLERLAKLEMGWDSYDAEPPNTVSLYWAKQILEILFDMNFCPMKIVPSAENGVGIVFRKGDRYADVECFNTGEIVAVTNTRSTESEAWEIAPSPEALKAALERICVHINA
jgi:hypothetical protein